MSDIESTKTLLRKFGISDYGFNENDIESVVRAVSDTQSEFGMIRFQMGALLLAVKQKEMWKGRASSFSEYLESEKIKPSAANQYMKVAEKLLFELKLELPQLVALSRCSMTTLAKAAGKMSKENKDDIILILETLSDRDASHAIDNYKEHTTPIQNRLNKASPAAQKVIDSFYKLPNDMRMEVIRKISGRNAGIQHWAASNVVAAQNEEEGARQ